MAYGRRHSDFLPVITANLIFLMTDALRKIKWFPSNSPIEKETEWVYMINIQTFNAVCISCSDEDDVLTIGVGDDNHDPKSYFIIGRFDEDGLSVDECIGFQSDSTEYELAGAIEAILLNSNSLIVTLNERAANKTGFKHYKADIQEKSDTTQLKIFIQDIFSDSTVSIKVE